MAPNADEYYDFQLDAKAYLASRGVTSLEDWEQRKDALVRADLKRIPQLFRRHRGGGRVHSGKFKRSIKTLLERHNFLQTHPIHADDVPQAKYNGMSVNDIIQAVRDDPYYHVLDSEGETRLYVPYVDARLKNPTLATQLHQAAHELLVYAGNRRAHPGNTTGNARLENKLRRCGFVVAGERLDFLEENNFTVRQHRISAENISEQSVHEITLTGEQLATRAFVTKKALEDGEGTNFGKISSYDTKPAAAFPWYWNSLTTCVVCGVSDKRVLTQDHVVCKRAGGEKNGNPSDMTQAQLEAELPLLQCLCKNHHYHKSFQDYQDMRTGPDSARRENVRNLINGYKRSLENCLYCDMQIVEGNEHCFTMHHVAPKGICGLNGECIVAPKRFGIGNFNFAINKRNWDMLCEELATTVLLCHDCHHIFHFYRTPLVGIWSGLSDDAINSHFENKLEPERWFQDASSLSSSSANKENQDNQDDGRKMD